MTGKLRPNKDILIEYIDKIQEISSITQGKISRLAGYDTENYISEAKSNDNVTDALLKAVKSLYERAKIDPSILSVKIEKNKNYDITEEKENIVSEPNGPPLTKIEAMAIKVESLTVQNESLTMIIESKNETIKMMKEKIQYLEEEISRLKKESPLKRTARS